MAVQEVTKVIDAVGMACPGPLMALIGDVIDVRSSDLGSLTDIPAWVAKAGHELVEVIPAEGYSSLIVRKVR